MHVALLAHEQAAHKHGPRRIRRGLCAAHPDDLRALAIDLTRASIEYSGVTPMNATGECLYAGVKWQLRVDPTVPVGQPIVTLIAISRT
jgi:hypothetical protein